MNDDLSQKIMERIDAGRITQRPRWLFVFSRISFWLFALLSILCGSAAIGVMLFLFFDFHHHGLWVLPHSMTEILLMIPFVWIIALVLLIASAQASVTHTRRGYRYSPLTAVGVCLLASLFGGIILNSIGAGKALHELLNTIPAYHSAVYDSRDAWTLPEQGRLAGVVTSVQDATRFSLVDFEGHLWQIRIASSSATSFSPQASTTIRMIGSGDPFLHLFVAYSMYQWEP